MRERVDEGLERGAGRALGERAVDLAVDRASKKSAEPTIARTHMSRWSTSSAAALRMPTRGALADVAGDDAFQPAAAGAGRAWCRAAVAPRRVAAAGQHAVREMRRRERQRALGARTQRHGHVALPIVAAGAPRQRAYRRSRAPDAAPAGSSALAACVAPGLCGIRTSVSASARPSRAAGLPK